MNIKILTSSLIALGLVSCASIQDNNSQKVNSLNPSIVTVKLTVDQNQNPYDASRTYTVGKSYSKSNSKSTTINKTVILNNTAPTKLSFGQNYDYIPQDMVDVSTTSVETIKPLENNVDVAIGFNLVAQRDSMNEDTILFTSSSSLLKDYNYNNINSKNYNVTPDSITLDKNSQFSLSNENPTFLYKTKINCANCWENVKSLYSSYNAYKFALSTNEYGNSINTEYNLKDKNDSSASYVFSDSKNTYIFLPYNQYNDYKFTFLSKKPINYDALLLNGNYYQIPIVLDKNQKLNIKSQKMKSDITITKL